MRVLFADDHEAIHFLASHVAKVAFPEDLEMHNAKSADELLSLLDAHEIDLVVLDLVMPGPVKRIGLIQAVHAHPCKPNILVYSGETNPPLVAAAMAAGAVGYVPKGAPMHSLIKAMQLVAVGDAYIDPSIEKLASEHPWHSLSVAERDVLRQVAGGRALKQVASDTDRAYSTIASLRTRGLEKLGIRSQEELLAYFYQSGLDYELDSGFRTTPPGIRKPVPAKEPQESEGNVVALRPGGLSAEDLEACETIAMMLLRFDEAQARENLSFTKLTFDELQENYGRPDLVSQSNGWRFPVRRWSIEGFNLLAIDLGRQRAFFSTERHD